METHNNGHRYYNYCKWEDKKNQPYDYARNGLLKHLMSTTIIESKNSTLQYLLKYIENTFIIMMKNIERFKHFKDYAFMKY